MADSQPFSELADYLDSIVSSPSVAGRPAGSSDAGTKFEGAIEEVWQRFALMHQPTIKVIRITDPNPRKRVTGILSLRNPANGAEMLFPTGKILLDIDNDEVSEIPESWLQRKFFVSDLIEGHLGKGPYSFAPPTQRDSPNYYGSLYPQLYAGKTTNFDWCIALSDRGMLIEKMLFEYKSAKSSLGQAIDGNAHERLTFQTLQYLEIASRLPSCSLNVIMSSAFAQYKNKYHPSFNQQSIRLGDAFRWFSMRIFTCHSEYVALFTMLSQFLLHGVRPTTDYRSMWEKTSD